MSFFKKWFRPESQSHYFSYTSLGQALWSPRDYVTLTEEGYRQNVIVYRAVNLVARGAASVPWILYKGEEEIDSHPLLTLLNTPNPRQGGSAFMESLISYLLLSGNAYVYNILVDDLPQELYSLRPDRMKVIPGPSMIPEAYEYKVGDKVDIIPNGPRLLHLHLFNPLNDWYGMSPLEAAARSIDQHNAVSGHNLSLLQNGGRPTGALMVKSDMTALTDEQRDRLKEEIKENYQGALNAGKMIVLEGDFEWKEMGASLKDLDYIDGKHLSAREISQAFGVPPMLVGVPGDATFANYREARLHLWEDTIIPLLESLTLEFNKWLAPLYGDDFKLYYDVDAIPALSAKREALWDKVNKCNFLTINEKRQAIGYHPLQGYDVLDKDLSSLSNF